MVRTSALHLSCSLSPPPTQSRSRSLLQLAVFPPVVDCAGLACKLNTPNGCKVGRSNRPTVYPSSIPCSPQPCWRHFARGPTRRFLRIYGVYVFPCCVPSYRHPFFFAVSQLLCAEALRRVRIGYSTLLPTTHAVSYFHSVTVHTVAGTLCNPSHPTVRHAGALRTSEHTRVSHLRRKVRACLSSCGLCLFGLAIPVDNVTFIETGTGWTGRMASALLMIL